MKTKILVVAGPTASGKTGLGVALAQRLNGEIVCADSMQIYTGMPIATAAPTPAERQAAVHHLAEILSPDTPFSVAQYCTLAAKAVADISARGKVPILVGGTGLFIDSFVDHIQFADVQTDPSLRRELLAQDGDTLYRTLQQADPAAAEGIHPNNKNRVVRALELYYAGTTKTRQNATSRLEESPYDALYFVLQYQNRQVLYDRINTRVDAMVAAGLVQEAQQAYAACGPTARQAIGHKELLPYLEGSEPLDTAVERLKQETRRYAKRQMTWFKRRQGTVVLEPDTMNTQALIAAATAQAEEFLYGKNKKKRA